MSKCEWDATTPYQCLTHNTQWLDDESDRCEYKRMCDAEAALQRVRELCESATVSISKGCTCWGNKCSGCGYGTPLGWNLDPDAILRILDGGDA